MQHSPTTAKQEEQLNTQSDAEKQTNKNYPLITREKIDNTPFWIVGNEEIGYKITWGRYTFNDEPINTIEKTRDWFAIHTWDIILHLVAIGTKIATEMAKEKP